ncbi:MAG: flagellar hook-basal body complex protein FliE [Caldilineae bacterium]|nr:MAG: flagellar hook-basal body complex protein FliE [Caldilineae bacterium]
MQQIDGNVARRTGANAGTTQVAEDMGALLRKAIADLDASQKVADRGIVALAANEPVDLHQVMLQMEEASIRLNLALQVRNKIVEAYQEIQRMQL